jgi:hypothetical protein
VFGVILLVVLRMQVGPIEIVKILVEFDGTRRRSRTALARLQLVAPAIAGGAITRRQVAIAAAATSAPATSSAAAAFLLVALVARRIGGRLVTPRSIFRTREFLRGIGSDIFFALVIEVEIHLLATGLDIFAHWGRRRGTTLVLASARFARPISRTFAATSPSSAAATPLRVALRIIGADRAAFLPLAARAEGQIGIVVAIKSQDRAGLVDLATPRAAWFANARRFFPLWHLKAAGIEGARHEHLIERRTGRAFGGRSDVRLGFARARPRGR